MILGSLRHHCGDSQYRHLRLRQLVRTIKHISVNYEKQNLSETDEIDQTEKQFNFFFFQVELHKMSLIYALKTLIIA